MTIVPRSYGWRVLALLAVIWMSACSPSGEIRGSTPTSGYTVTATVVVTPTETATSVPFSDCSGGYIALTFDDGPFAGQTDQLISALKASHLRATFFDLGQHLVGNDSLVQAQVENGWVGNHSWSHKDMTMLTRDQITTELTDTQEGLKAITGQTPVFFRPPYLKSTGTLKDVEASLGLTEVMTSLDSEDWSGVTTDEIVANVSLAWPGAVILMHDNLSTTRAAIPLIEEFMSTQKLCPGKIDPASGLAVAP